MQGIWAGQKARGHIHRSAQEAEVERQAARDEWEERMARITRIQEEAQRVQAGGQSG
jgi:hypothetical protein